MSKTKTNEGERKMKKEINFDLINTLTVTEIDAALLGYKVFRTNDAGELIEIQDDIIALNRNTDGIIW